MEIVEHFVHTWDAGKLFASSCSLRAYEHLTSRSILSVTSCLQARLKVRGMKETILGNLIDACLGDFDRHLDLLSQARSVAY